MHTFLEMGLGNALTAGAVALVAFGVSRVCRRRPAFVHCLWLVVFLKLLTPPAFGVRLPWSLAWAPEPAGRPNVAPAAVAEPPMEARMETDLILVPADDGAADAKADEPPTLPAADPVPVVGRPAWEEAAGLVWLAGSLLWFGWMGLHIYRFRRVLRAARPAPAVVQQQARELAGRLRLRHCPLVWLVPGSVSPMLWAAGWSARLLFPAGLLERLDDAQRASILAHELAHLRRRDHWVRLLELAAIGLYWWHPVVWWARRELHEVEEQCCDAWAVWALEGAGRHYALALLETVEFFSASRSVLPVAASGIGTVPQLRRRLVMIMQGTTPRSLSRAGGLAALGLGALLMLPTLPLDAQAPPKPDATPAEDQALQQQQRKLQEQLDRVQAEIQKRRVERQQQAQKVLIIRDLDARLQDLKKSDKLPPEVKQALAEVEQARANLVAAEKKLRDVAAKSGLPFVEVHTPGNYVSGADKLGQGGLRYRIIMDDKAQKALGAWGKVYGYQQAEPASQEQRLRALEQRLEKLQRTLEGLQREQKRPAGYEPAEKLAPDGGRP